MPNIEIHGYNRGAANMLREQIFGKMFADKPYAEDMVVTAVPSTVINKKDFQQPFIRLLCPDAKEAEEILEILKQNIPEEDIEYVKIEKFIPGTKT